MYRNRNWLDRRSRSTLVNSLIQCYFDYCCSSWYEGLSKTFKKKLQILQNKTIRFILNLEPRTRITCDIFESVNMLCVPDRVSQLRLNHVFNIAQNLAPSYLGLHFERNNNSTRAGSNLNFQVPRVGTHNKSNFYYNAILDWNSLPVNIKSLRSRGSFKTAVKEHLTERAREKENSDFIHA